MRILQTAFRWLALLTALSCAASAGTLLLQNAVVYDGSGRPGFRADVRIDGERIVAVAPHLKDPGAPPDGIVGVMVAGQWVVEEGKVTGARPGQVLRHPGAGRARR